MRSKSAAIPCGPINSIEQAFADPQVLHRGMKVELTRADGVKTPGIAIPSASQRPP